MEIKKTNNNMGNTSIWRVGNSRCSHTAVFAFHDLNLSHHTSCVNDFASIYDKIGIFIKFRAKNWLSF